MSTNRIYSALSSHMGLSPDLGDTIPNALSLRITPQRQQLCPALSMRNLPYRHSVRSENSAGGVTRIGSLRKTGVKPGDRRRGVGVLDEGTGTAPTVPACVTERTEVGIHMRWLRSGINGGQLVFFAADANGSAMK
ncbi:hypothetical protein PSPO01_03851 [Paraphaeosphaeria sporulosa]